MSHYAEDVIFPCYSEYSLQSDSLSPCELLRTEAVAKQQGNVPQCAEDGKFRPLQCSMGGQECWCVDGDGQEVPGTRTNGSAPLCVSPCQLQSLLKCSPSGLFEEVQCDHSRGQCWCVDQNGMELYGTRQNGRPSRCPGSCEVRSRSLLHSSTPHTPPQCDGSGSFLPVQCVFINTTTGTHLDMMTVFNSFPEAFETFSGFRKLFPTVSSYCFCSDSRGREMHNTGVELLLSDVYDSAFDADPPVRSFAQSNIYRVLQRRMLAVRLRITGRFRCPSPCEEERWAATEAHSVYIPSCEPGGAFTTRQCQQGGQCWCVDHTGQELPGTRQQGLLDCKLGPDSCPARRHQALFHLLSGSVAVPLQTSISDRSQTSCNSLVQTLRDLLPVEVEFPPFLSQLVEVVDGLFRTVGGALRALSHSSPQRLNENLFGGKFLKEIASSNFSGVLGSQGTFVRDWVSGKGDSLQENRVLVESVRRVLGDPAFLSSLKVALQGHSSLLPPEQILTPLLRSCSGQDVTKHATFLPRCTPSGAFQEIQCDSGECWCVDSQGHEVLGSRTAGRPSRCPSICERQQWSALNMRKNMAAGAEIYVPVCSEDGDFLPLQCVGSHCFCVDAKGNNVSPAGGALFAVVHMSRSCHSVMVTETGSTDSVSTAQDGKFSVLQTGGDAGWCVNPQNGEQIQMATLSPGGQLTCPSRCQLLAFQCKSDGSFQPLQCDMNSCWCVSEDGQELPASGRSVSLCDASSVHLQCDNDSTDLMLMVTWSAKVSDLATSDLPNLQGLQSVSE
ncbi:hypothetical protein fugu_009539 [Takifugu bimaculatus]|uniref:Thyroglobulin type-1 domain-containing protein n=1 Tax=Takifugu bimaculatus TaxID=433685 RepID=A0A4Z2CCT5_9TELE|nr:hypothetical protein fugu_009539 [Takifugu bimaculatus]